MKAIIEVAQGLEPGNLEPVMNRVAIERAIITKPGIVKKISGLEDALKLPGIEEIIINVREGDKVNVPRSNVEKAGNIIVVGETLQEAEESFKKCMEVLTFEIIEEPVLSMEVINLAAREKFKKICYVCRTCDGRDCPTGIPGMGGAGTGASFRRNIESLQKYKINTSLMHNVFNPDTSAEFLGRKLSIPVMAAPITGTVTNMGGAIDELEYNRKVVKGCLDAGTLAFLGDGATPDKYKIALQAASEFGGSGIPIFKPRSDNGEIVMRIKAAEDAGVIAAGIDVDAAVLKTMAMKNQAVGPKSLKDLKKIIASTKLPFILKGIMNPKEASMAVEAGASAVVVSNHGGRVLDEMPGGMDVLDGIVKAVKGKITIIIDGGFRTGVDILKALAVGADLVLIGRPIAIAAVGMGAEGVAFYINTLKSDLEKSMILTGSSKTGDISGEIIIRI